MFETPLNIARELASLAPINSRHILEPAVGRGMLLDALLERLGHDVDRVVCLDKDPTSIVCVTKKYAKILGDRFCAVNVDFLEWSSSRRTLEDETFDCIVMNSPFAGRNSEHLILPDLVKIVPQLRVPSRIPIECAFMVRALQLLRRGGMLLTVVPPSIVSSERTKWLREYMTSAACVKTVVELPPYTFPHVESRVYLIAIKKTAKLRGTLIRNGKNGFQVANSKLDSELRFDWRYCYAKKGLSNVTTRWPNLAWTEVRKIASIRRGSVPSPMGAREALHTKHFSGGSWVCGENDKQFVRVDENSGLQKGDIIMKRVGRNCAVSIGVSAGLESFLCSDCLFVLRPNNQRASRQMLFALRVVLAWAGGASLVERGTGASYLTRAVIERLHIPMKVAGLDRAVYRAYLAAVRGKNSNEMLKIEAHVRHEIGLE